MERLTESDRMRVVAQLKVYAADGALSGGELESRMESAFRARTRADLDAALAGLAPNSRARAEAVGTYGLSNGAVRYRSPLRRQLLTGSLFLAFWLVVCALTGASAMWYLLTVAGSLIGFTIRLVRRDRRRAFRGWSRS